MKRLFFRCEYSTSEREASDMFSLYGIIGEVLICRHKSGESKGFGFVEVERPDEAIADLHNKMHRGRPLHVEIAQDRAPGAMREARRMMGIRRTE
ncbi:MAG: hypothetical protein ACYDC3_10265 [Candidatus Binataceae bacterium]